MKDALNRGLIPAHAGKTGYRSRHDVHGRAHPRSRGENDAFARAFDLAVGSSPLTRGKHVLTSHHARAIGLIPAHAGKTVWM